MKNLKEIILIVDDEEDIRLNLRDYAELEGYAVLEAGNGEEALKVIEAHSPDLVISDLMMPIRDGMQLLEDIHRQQIAVPMILMTAFGTIEYAVRAMKQGAADFITKPIDLDYMMRVIKRVLRTSSLEKEVKEQQRQINEDLSLAAKIQECMLPQSVETPQFQFHYRYQPLREIGGDYLTVHQFHDGKIAIALYDVCGHGVSAALIATVVHNQLQTRLAEERPPANIVDLVNRFVTRNLGQTGMFITMVIAVIDLDDDLLTVFNAGHPEVLVWQNAVRSFESIASHVAPIGFHTNIVSHETESRIRLASGDRILLYTDGFTDARNPSGDTLGIKGVKQIAEKSIYLGFQEFFNQMCVDLSAYRSGDAEDDITMVLIDVLSA